MLRASSCDKLDKMFNEVDLGKSVFKAKHRSRLGYVKSVASLGRAKSSIEADVNDIRQRL